MTRFPLRSITSSGPGRAVPFEVGKDPAKTRPTLAMVNAFVNPIGELPWKNRLVFPVFGLTAIIVVPSPAVVLLLKFETRSLPHASAPPRGKPSGTKARP